MGAGEGYGASVIDFAYDAHGQRRVGPGNGNGNNRREGFGHSGGEGVSGRSCSYLEGKARGKREGRGCFYALVPCVCDPLPGCRTSCLPSREAIGTGRLSVGGEVFQPGVGVEGVGGKN